MKAPLALIIEDNEEHAALFAEALRAAEFETEIILDGDTALTRLAATTPALVVLDLRLPKASGEDVLRQIRADARLAETYVMLISADPLRAESIQDEADLVLIKPVDFAQLCDLASRVRARV